MPQITPIPSHIYPASRNQWNSVFPEFALHVERNNSFKWPYRLSKLVLWVRDTKAKMNAKIQEEAKLYIWKPSRIAWVNMPVRCWVSVDEAAKDTACVNKFLPNAISITFMIDNKTLKEAVWIKKIIPMSLLWATAICLSYSSPRSFPRIKFIFNKSMVYFWENSVP